MKIGNVVDTSAVVKYIFDRQNEDGGYTFCQQTASSAQDTYYAIEILRLLNTKLTNVENTIAFLKSLQHPDGSFDSIKVAYYVLKTLYNLGSELIKQTDWLENTSETIIEKLTSSDIYIETISEIEGAHLAVELLYDLSLKLNQSSIIKQLSKLQNNDGSFGSDKHLKIASTYHAISILKILNFNNPEMINRALDWVRRCEVPSGGFVGEPEYLSTIFLEETYFGIKSLSIIDKKPLYPIKNLSLISKFQNANGGFRRSVFLGLSEFESTYQALSTVITILTST